MDVDVSAGDLPEMRLRPAPTAMAAFRALVQAVRWCRLFGRRRFCARLIFAVILISDEFLKNSFYLAPLLHENSTENSLYFCNSPLSRTVRELWADGPSLLVQLILNSNRVSFFLSPYLFLPQPNPSSLLGAMEEPP